MDTPVSNTATWPYTAVGNLVVSFKGKIRTGSGTLIGPTQVLTAAHNLPPAAWGSFGVRFNPAQNQGQLPFGSFDVVQAALPKAWTSHEDPSWDIAVLLLQQPIGLKTGTYPVAAFGAALKGAPIALTGYPTVQGGRMWTHRATVAAADGPFLMHTANTRKGESGSAICLVGPSHPLIVAVHTWEDAAGARGVRLSHDHLKFINAVA